MIVKTGFGYFMKDGKILRKYELLPGKHPDPVGYEAVEVNSKEDLDRIVCDKSLKQLQNDTLLAQRNYHKNSIAAKLKSIGFVPEEINILIG